MTSLQTLPPARPAGSAAPLRGAQTVALVSTPKDPWAGLREASPTSSGLVELLKTADERLSPLLSALTPAAGSPPPEPRPMPPASNMVPPLTQQIAEFLERRRRAGGNRGIG